MGEESACEHFLSSPGRLGRREMIRFATRRQSLFGVSLIDPRLRYDLHYYYYFFFLWPMFHLSSITGGAFRWYLCYLAFHMGID